MICVFCDNKTATGCIHCNPNGFGPGKIVEVPPETDFRQMKFHLSSERSQLDRIEALLMGIRDLLEAVFGSVEEYHDSGQPKFTEPAKEGVNHERATEGRE